MIPLIIIVLIIGYLIYHNNKVVKSLNDKENDTLEQEFSIDDYDFDSKTMTFNHILDMPDSSYSNGTWIYYLFKSDGNYEIDPKNLSVKLETLSFEVPKNKKSNQFTYLIENKSISEKYIRYLNLVEKYGSALDTINLASNEPERQELSNLHFEHFQEARIYDLNYLNLLKNINLKSMDPAGLNHIRLRVLAMHPNLINRNVLVEHINLTLDQMKQIKDIVTFKANQIGLILLPYYDENKLLGYRISSDFIESNKDNKELSTINTISTSTDDLKKLKNKYQEEIDKCNGFEESLPKNNLILITYYEKQFKSIKETLKILENKSFKIYKAA